MNQTDRDWADRHVMYRCFDARGSLLYVGATNNLPRRLKHHRNNAAWFADLARLRVQVFADAPAARAAERQAIKGERPAHNIRSTPAGSPRGSRHNPRRIHPAGPELIRSFLAVRRMPIRELAELCGGAKYRTAIGHLLTGERTACNAKLAEALELVITGSTGGSLFTAPRHLRVVA